MLFKNSVRTSKRTPHFTITKINWLMMFKDVFNTKPIGIRKIGRPEFRWEDDVIQDIKTLGVKNCRNLAMDKES
jgi:hypothetical protein